MNTFKNNNFFHKSEHGSILVVEDDEMSSLLIDSILSKNSVPYCSVKTEKDAVSQLERYSFNTIFIGINTPEVAEKNIINEIKNHKTDAHLIAITSSVIKNAIEVYLKNNFDKILLKPYDEKKLLEIIDEYNVPELDFEQANIHAKYSFNLDQLNSIGNNNNDFILKMLKKFILSASECAESITQALLNNDCKLLKASAHKAIPSCSTMGLNGLVKDLEYIEANANIGTEEAKVKKRAQLVKEKSEAVIIEIQDYLKQLEKK